MSKVRILVIDDDEWVTRLLTVAMKEGGMEVSVADRAESGFFAAVEDQPDAIVCAVELPDRPGFWVAQRIRSHPSRISAAPFLFLSNEEDRAKRLAGFQVGADAFLTKPFRMDEVVAQVDALLQMAARLRKQRGTRASLPPPGAVMSGDLAHLSVATMLTLLDLERRSGTVTLTSNQSSGSLVILKGNVVGATLSGAPSPPLETVRELMSWTQGRIHFHQADHTPHADLELTPINALLMEAARLEDEARDRPPVSSGPSIEWAEEQTTADGDWELPPPSSASFDPPAPQDKPSFDPKIGGVPRVGHLRGASEIARSDGLRKAISPFPPAVTRSMPSNPTPFSASRRPPASPPSPARPSIPPPSNPGAPREGPVPTGASLPPSGGGRVPFKPGR